jgi:quercetin 2,3-dioxygenase
MKTVIHRAGDRGAANHGWLDAKHSFSFAGYHNPDKVHFGALRVLNDDIVAGGGGFPTHPHDNMEIVTIPLKGALQHKDSTGGNGIIKAGDVQIMSAGTGVRHSEFNASATEAVNLFQCWVFPKERNITPRYDQRSFNAADRINKWQVVVSPKEADNALWINQDARFLLTSITAGTSLDYTNAFSGNGVYLMVINGTVTVDGQMLEPRDAIGIAEADSFSITASSDAELMAIEVPMF